MVAEGWADTRLFRNDYFDDTYWHNGQTVKQKGYCTDVFFDAALRFIDGKSITVG
ncbi:MAG: hypothetical protein Ct9H300mP1_19060 [Planctomycetaceae bacterium]|nr:MAG: hypothetical protein Ct9H300mP1_19060 [Planctomycetaceae bacterium]